MLEIRNLSFSYDGTPVFSGLCLSLPDGSRTALLAPSGFGKTTLLRLLCGSLTPQSGSITRASGGGDRHGIPGGPSAARLHGAGKPAAGGSGAAGHGTHRPAGRTGTVRLGKCPPRETLGRNAPPGSHCPALVFHSPLVIMDEPFKGLDETTLAATLACVDHWLGDRTFLLVTHSPQEAERLGCRITRLDELTRTGSEKQN